MCGLIVEYLLSKHNTLDPFSNTTQTQKKNMRNFGWPKSIDGLIFNIVYLEVLELWKLVPTWGIG
jgi:hypothetical protein